MGTNTGSQTADFDYPLLFTEKMNEALIKTSRKHPFKYVQLGGKFVRTNQDEKLWFLEMPRKLKVRHAP